MPISTVPSVTDLQSLPNPPPATSAISTTTRMSDVPIPPTWRFSTTRSSRTIARYITVPRSTSSISEPCGTNIAYQSTVKSLSIEASVRCRINARRGGWLRRQWRCGAGCCVPMASTMNSTSIGPAFSNTKVTGTRPSFWNGAFSPMNMM